MRIIGFIPFPRVLVLCEMQSVSSRIWTRVAVSISCEDNHYTTGTSINLQVIKLYSVNNYRYRHLHRIQNKGCINHHHHHHVVPLARISLTLSRHFSLSFITFGRSSGLHPVSSHSCCMYVRAGRPAFAWPYAGVHRSTSLMSSSLLLQQSPACLVRLVFVMGGKWPYSWCLVGCCRQDLFNIALNILV